MKKSPFALSEGVEHEMAILDATGDTKIIWNADNHDEVQNAKDTFNRLVKEKGFAAFSVGRDGEKSDKIKNFNADLEKIILVPPMKGG